MNAELGPSILIVHRSSPIDYGVVVSYEYASKNNLLDGYHDHGVVAVSAKELLHILNDKCSAPTIIDKGWMNQIRDYRTGPQNIWWKQS